MHPYARDLKALLTRNANPKQAAPMKRYMRDQFEYLGIKSPQLAELLREHTASMDCHRRRTSIRSCATCGRCRQREFQYAATSLLGKLETQLPAGFIRTLEYLLVTKSWWDTVDTHLNRHGRRSLQALSEGEGEVPGEVAEVRNFWLRRATILFQLNYKQDTDFALMQDIIRENLGSRSSSSIRPSAGP